MKIKLLYGAIVIMTIVLGIVSYFLYDVITDEKKEIVNKSENMVIGNAQDSTKEVETTNTIQNEDNKESNLNDLIEISILNMFKFSPDDEGVYSYTVNSDVQFTNKTEKDIVGFDSDVYFYDIFDEIVFTTNLRYEWETIKKNNSTIENLSIELNQFNDGDMRFYNISKEKLRIEYDIYSIVFADGTTMKAGE